GLGSRRNDVLRRFGGSRLPHLRPAEGNRASRRGVRRRRQRDRLRRADELLELPALHLLPGPEHAAHHPAELRHHLGPEPDPSLGRRESALELADGSDPVRLCGAGEQGQVRPDPGLQLLGRRDVLGTTRDPILKAGAPRVGAPVVTFDGTRFLAKIRFFPPSSAPLLAEVAGWCGATLASEADASRAIVDVAALDEAGP